MAKAKVDPVVDEAVPQDAADEEETRQKLKEIVEETLTFEWRDPREMQKHALNWKIHTSVQREAYRELHDEVGWAGALLLNTRTGRLLDGHMRLDDALENNEERVPVLVIDVPEEKELMILEYLDMVGSLFQAKQSAVSVLENLHQAKSNLLRSIAQGNVPEDDEAKGQGDDINMGKPLPDGGLSLVLGEQYNYIVLLFKNEIDWTAAQDLFGIERVQCVFNSGLGVGRVVDGGAYLEKVYKERLGIGEAPSVSPGAAKALALAQESKTQMLSKAKRIGRSRNA